MSATSPSDEKTPVQKRLDFPVWIKGTIDAYPVTIPFVSIGDLNNYLESLSWLHTRTPFMVSLVVEVEGDEVQKIEISQEKH